MFPVSGDQIRAGTRYKHRNVVLELGHSCIRLLSGSKSGGKT